MVVVSDARGFLHCLFQREKETFMLQKSQTMTLKLDPAFRIYILRDDGFGLRPPDPHQPVHLKDVFLCSLAGLTWERPSMSLTS